MSRAWFWCGAFVLSAFAITLISTSGTIYGLLGATIIWGMIVLIVISTWLALLFINKLSAFALLSVLLLLVAFYVPLLGAEPLSVVLALGVLWLLISLLASGVHRLSKRGVNTFGIVLCVLASVPLLVIIVAFFMTGWSSGKPVNWPPIAAAQSTSKNPGLPGDYDVSRLNYGSGVDSRRERFAAGVDWRSESVSAERLLDGWEGLSGWTRTAYWGFDASALPVQGRVWLPGGDGPFPIVLMVHGNHEMEDFSDPGYDYLGEHFASHGLIAVSVDENFLNSSIGDLVGGPDAGLEEESDARAWLLLQHLTQWRGWNQDPMHPMYGKVDLDRVVLIGHSRGGEAVSEAVLFNRLSHYPDDALETFDFEFGIKGVIAIAPVDHQYHPRDRDTPFADVNYLVIHGSHDSDVTSYSGAATYARLRFDRCEDCFKAGFYLVNANHGQFNSSWGRYDRGMPFAKFLNTQPLLAPEDQRAVARILFTGFIRAVVFDEPEYRRFVARPETGHQWFPKGTSYLSNYRDAGQIVLADYEEDADVTTGSSRGVRLAGRDLGEWKEAEVALKWRDLDSAAVLVGWTAEEGRTPGYELQFADAPIQLEPTMTLSFGMALAKDGVKGSEDFNVPDSLDVRLELVDAADRSAVINLANRRVLYPQVDPVLFKFEMMDSDPPSEVVFQRYTFALQEWLAVNPDLDITKLVRLRLLFPNDVPAKIWLDDVAISPEGY